MGFIHQVMYFGFQHPVEFALAGLVTACVLFGIRERYRVVYALIEIGFGLLAMMNAAPRFTAGWTDDLSSDLARSETHWSLITIAGALYFLVRGIDNLDKGFAGKAAWRRARAALGLPGRQ